MTGSDDETKSLSHFSMTSFWVSAVGPFQLTAQTIAYLGLADLVSWPIPGTSRPWRARSERQETLFVYCRPGLMAVDSSCCEYTLHIWNVASERCRVYSGVDTSVLVRADLHPSLWRRAWSPIYHRHKQSAFYALYFSRYMHANIFIQAELW